MTSRLLILSLKALLLSLGVLVLTVLLGWYSLPRLLTDQLPTFIGQHTGKTVSLASASLQLSPLTLRLQGFVMQEKNGQPFLAFDTLSIQLEPWQTLPTKALHLKSIVLSKPTLSLSRGKDGKVNIPNWIAGDPQPKAADSPVLPMQIGQLSITDGTVVWHDAQTAKPWSETLQSFQLNISNVSTYAIKPTAFKLSLALQSGGQMAWEGNFNLNPASSQGQLKINTLNAAKFLALFAPNSGITINGNNFTADYQATYKQDKLTLSFPKATLTLDNIGYSQAGQALKIAALRHETALTLDYAAGQWQLAAKAAKVQADNIRIQDRLLGNLKRFTAEASYQVSQQKNHVNVTVDQGALTLTDWQIADQATRLGFFPTIKLQGLQANLDKRQIRADSLNITQGELTAWLNADGSSNYQAFARPAAPDTPVTQPESPWRIGIDTIAVDNGTVNFEDRTLPKPLAMALSPINLQVQGYDSTSSTSLPFQLSMGLNQGSLALKGTLLLAPFMAEMTVVADNLDLEKFQPYYDQFIRLDVIDGMLDINGKLSINRLVPLDLQFSGDSTIEDLLIRDQRVHKDFLKWERLTLKTIVADVLNQHYTAGELTLNKPYARVTIRKDKTVNFANLLIDQATPKRLPPAQPLPPQTKPLYFKLGKIQIIDGSSDFTDLSLLLPFSAHIKSLDGGASGVSSDKTSQVQVVLKGNAYDLAPVDITGNISPFLGEYDVKINFNGLPMPLVSSYMVQFAGYKVEKGKMTLDLHYRIADKKLTAFNHFLIDQFELGERVENPDAISLPLKLAVTLLKDRNGKIKMDVPISGDLDNPQFNIGSIVAEALVNAIGKVLSSPFSAFALLTSNPSNDLSTISFKAGSATLDKPQQSKLDDIANALNSRPELMLEIKGLTRQEQDWPAISDDALYDQLKIRRATEINQKTARKIRAEYVELSAEDYRRLLADMFIEKFPLLAERSLLGTPRLKAANGGDFYEAAKQKLQAIINPEQERLKELANERSQAIAKYLVQHGGITQDHIYIVDSVVNTDKDNKDIASLLSLKTY